MFEVEEENLRAAQTAEILRPLSAELLTGSGLHCGGAACRDGVEC